VALEDNPPFLLEEASFFDGLNKFDLRKKNVLSVSSNISYLSSSFSENLQSGSILKGLPTVAGSLLFKKYFQC